jgi:hypothetical protein
MDERKFVLHFELLNDTPTQVEEKLKLTVDGRACKTEKRIRIPGNHTYTNMKAQQVTAPGRALAQVEVREKPADLLFDWKFGDIIGREVFGDGFEDLSMYDRQGRPKQ